MAAADGKSDNGRRGAPSLEKKEILKPRFSGPKPRSKTTFWTKFKEHDNNNKQNIKIKSFGSIEGSSVSVFYRKRKLNGKLILNIWVNKAIMYSFVKTPCRRSCQVQRWSCCYHPKT